MSTLIIYLPLVAAGAAASYDYVRTPAGRTAADHASVPLALIPPAERGDRKSTRLNSSHIQKSRMPSSA